MIPVELSLRNFLSYGDGPTTLDFTRFHVACLTGDNGHGKSALLDAITYALWGEARKGQGERKPDEGLLRIGSQEMRIEFSFDLATARFRVIRGFRKGKRASASDLELQVWDPSAELFRPISDGASTTRTQQRITRLLAMDYETFINSAFILQGRADEFTRRGARERKRILADILGLSQYDRLQELARDRYLESERHIQAVTGRIEETVAELTDGDGCEARLAKLDDELTDLCARAAQAEQRRSAAMAQQLEADTISQGLREVDSHLDEARSSCEALQAWRRETDSQAGADRDLLTQADALERDLITQQTLMGRDRELNTVLQEVRTAEGTVAQLEAQIQEARSRAASQVAAWQARQDSLMAQLQQCNAVLARRADTEAQHRELLAARARLVELESTQARHRELREQQSSWGHRIEIERRRLVEGRDHLDRQIGKMEERIDASSRDAELLVETRRRIEVCARQVERLHRVRNEGIHKRSRLEELRSQAARLDAERKGTIEKEQLLRRADRPTCPLCKSRLDEAHRDKLSDELGSENRRLAEQAAEVRQGLQAIADELETMRAAYGELEPAPGDLERLQREEGRLSDRVSRRADAETELAQIQSQRKQIHQTLTEGTYAASERAAVRQLDEALAELGYVHADLEAARNTARQLAPVDVEIARLAEARTQTDRLEADLAEVVEQLGAEQERLTGDDLAPEARRDLARAREHLAGLPYDAGEHRRVHDCLADLGDVSARRVEIEAARRRQAVARERIGQIGRDLAALARRRGELEARQQAMRERSEHLAGVGDALADAEAQLCSLRSRRDQILQEKGLVEAQVARHQALSHERDQLGGRLKDHQDEARTYRILSQAFGKNGIQALIIESAIPEIEAEANSILRRLTDNRIQISIESLRDLKGGGTRETLDIKIADEVGVRPYHLYSGGEAFRTDFALRIALSKVLARRAGTRLRTLIIDEGFGTQDSHGLEQLREAIQEISRDFDKLLVVTHLAELRDAFPVQVQVTKDPDSGSHLNVIASPG